MEFLKHLLKQPYWVIALLLGVALVAASTVSFDRNVYWIAHGPQSTLLVAIGIALLVVSVAGFGTTLWFQHVRTNEGIGRGVDLTRVKEKDGAFSTVVSGCQIRVVLGRIEQVSLENGTAIVLPCNEYFDDKCVGDTRSSLGSYVNKMFSEQVEDFVDLTKAECQRAFGRGIIQQKTNTEAAASFSAGRSLLLLKPLGRATPLALVSTTTQRSGEGLSARISYLFHAMHELVKQLADARITDVAMPILGAGHGKIDPPLAFVGLLLAVAEAARHGQLRRATIVVFKGDDHSVPEVDSAVIRRALALIGDA